ncbi:MAG: hypothetical protein ACMVY4_04765 [Minwuia sp.]|uniref:hypothetical protein n=1 Tax=Minwuia sp. TaxID=2493630 RepID=UPI003A8733C6
MITDQDRFSYQKSTYERPTFPYVCGRACSFGKPCPNGPTFSGGCGGTTECTPFRNGDRWECRRAPASGGPCEDGPLPDGSCCMQHPPCTPRPSLRRRRQRISFLVAMFVVAAILAFLQFSPEAFQGDRAQASSIMPGPLSGAHSNFALEAKGCTACHEAHGLGVVAWAKAFVTSQSVGESCVGCHGFGGPADSPHNATFDNAVFKSDSPSAGMKTDCVMCHTEHKGQEANIATMRDQQCNSCHQATVKSFAKDHPDFGDNYPHRARGAIQFNHVKHFNEHFPKENATRNCVDCHDVKRAGLSVPAGSFEQNCASCHTSGIVDRPLYLIGVPYMEEDPFDPDTVAEVCGLTPDQIEYLQARADGDADAEAPEPYEYFYEDEGDYVTAVLALALGVPNDDLDAYTDPIGELYAEIAESGAQPLIDRLEALPGEPDARRLLRGLDGELVRRAACAWMQKEYYEAPSESAGGGWTAGDVSVTYVPTGHADPVARAWFDYAVNAPLLAETAGADEDVIAQAEALRENLLSDQGFGNCTKCHAVTQVTDKSAESGDPATTLMVEWGFQPVDDRPYVQYDHAPHVNLLGPGSLCVKCHKPNPEANYAASFSHFDATDYSSGFQAVSKQTCAECHTEAKVKQDCLLCHEYHLEPKFIESMVGSSEPRQADAGKDGG